MNTGWELGRGKRAGEKDLVDTGGGGRVMTGVGNDRGELDRGGRGRGGGSPVGKRRWENAGGGGDRLDPFNLSPTNR